MIEIPDPALYSKDQETALNIFLASVRLIGWKIAVHNKVARTYVFGILLPGITDLWVHYKENDMAGPLKDPNLLAANIEQTIRAHRMQYLVTMQEIMTGTLGELRRIH